LPGFDQHPDWYEVSRGSRPAGDPAPQATGADTAPAQAVIGSATRTPKRRTIRRGNQTATRQARSGEQGTSGQSPCPQSAWTPLVAGRETQRQGAISIQAQAWSTCWPPCSLRPFPSNWSATAYANATLSLALPPSPDASRASPVPLISPPRLRLQPSTPSNTDASSRDEFGFEPWPVVNCTECRSPTWTLRRENTNRAAPCPGIITVRRPYAQARRKRCPRYSW
jgi:hypothetical protein